MRSPITHRQRPVLLAAAAVAALALAACGGDDGDEPVGATNASNGAATQRCDTIKIADLDSPDTHASYYAIDQGLVKDDRIGRVEVDYQTVPQLVQNAGSDRYDVTSTSINGVVLVRKQSGRDYRIVALKQ